MTGEEMERAIEFLLKGQANHEARFGVLTDKVEELAEKANQLTAQVTETSKQLQTYAQTQSEFIRATTQSINGLAEAQARTDERLNKLIGLFEQHLTVGH
jgi:ABC-type transporter Mla subunit MlaD